MFDLNLFPFHYSAGREQDDLPGLQATNPPRRAERHRTGDLLTVLFSSASGQPLPGDLAGEAFTTLAGLFFQSGGTVTSALRSAIEALNEELLGRSQKSGAAQAIYLNALVLHNELAYLAHCGPTHTTIITPGGTHDFYDLQGSGKGLGIGQPLTMRLYQFEIASGDLLIFTPELPSTWSAAALTGSCEIPLEAFRRRLLNQAPPELRAGLIRVQDGNGLIHRSRLPGSAGAPVPSTPAASVQPVRPDLPQPPLPPPSIPAAPAQASAAASPAAPISPAPVAQPRIEIPPAPEQEPPVLEPAALEDSAVTAARRRIEERRARQAAAAASTAKAGGETQPEGPAPKRGLLARIFKRKEPAQTIVEGVPFEPVNYPSTATDTPEAAGEEPEPLSARPGSRKFLRSLAAFFSRARSTRQRTGRAVGGFLTRMVPGAASQNMSLSPATMLFIAIAVPVVVVAIATAVYFHSGASEQRAAYMQQAQAYAEQASNQKDATLRKNSWSQVIFWLNKADAFQSDDASQALRNRAQTELDIMDGITRLSLTPAFNGILPSSVNITRIAANGIDLYVLDSSVGRVLHLYLAGRSYEFDPNFSCGPGPVDDKVVGPLVGMATLPANNKFSAAVVAVDATGNLLYCINDDQPKSPNALSQPENNWGSISDMTLFNGNLYVLDKKNNGVFRFDGLNYEYTDRPRLFFGNEIPDLADVIDMTIYQDDLYLLRSSGKMTVCTYSGFEFSPTRCNDTNYNGRGGSVAKYSDTKFTQLQATEPPDPSLFILDSRGPAIFHYSLRLNFQRQLRQDSRTDFPLPSQPVTAFTIAPTRVIFLAFGNQLYFGTMP